MSNENTEILVNECLQYALGAEGYEFIFERLLAFIGRRFGCERTYIFEMNENQTFSNTYEWCAFGIMPQKQLLQNEPLLMIDGWMESFRTNRPVVVEDVRAIRKNIPPDYEPLLPQSTRCVAACPLTYRGTIIGFFCMDNPLKESLPQLMPFLQVMEHFVVSFMKQRDLLNKLEHLSYHDQLTGVLNRRAYKEKENVLGNLSSVGVLYGDVTGLKRVNDLEGHDAGDALICSCCALLEETFGGERIYRMGGDELMVICEDISREGFQRKCAELKGRLQTAHYHLAIGTVWDCPREGGIQALVSRAEARMYEDKDHFYSMTGIRPDTFRGMGGLYATLREGEAPENIQQYLRLNPDAIDPLVRTAGMPDSPVCLYIGDLVTNEFYISDNMREMFGFEGNVVYNLLEKWEAKICYQEDLEAYRQDIQSIWQKRRMRHDFKYRVYDRNGKLVWVHCRGRLYRNAEDEPRYFAGFITRQEFVIDPVTGFPREHAAVRRLTEIREQGKDTVVFGIGLNHFAEINEIKGKGIGEELLLEITGGWERELSQKAWFYRMDGIRFLAVGKPDCPETVEGFVRELKNSVRAACEKYDVTVKYPCSICVFHFPSDLSDPEELVENVVPFIDAAKDDIRQEYTSYSRQTVERYKQNAEFVLQLNEDVVNGFQNFRVVIQPIVQVGHGGIVCGEVLLRWRFRGQNVPPDHFIPLLEKRGLICQVGRWVFRETVRNLSRVASGDPKFRLSFNVSYYQISDEGFVPYMREVLDEFGIDGCHLTMELTEQHFDSEPELLMRFVEQCKELGMNVALDDFGSAYSSLVLLMKYPANVVKLDRSLLIGMANSEEKQNFLKTLVVACHNFGKQVCVEGVETENMVQVVQDTGGDLIQGFYFYRPLELDDFYRVMGEREEESSRQE